MPRRSSIIALAVTGIAASCVLVGIYWLGFNRYIFHGGELVDEQGKLVGHAYTTQPTAFASRYYEAADFLAANNYEQAEEIYRQLVQLEPNRPDALIGLAGAQLRQSKLGDARKNYASALMLEPSSIQALYGAGAVEETAGNLVEARSYYERSLTRAPDNTLGHYGMASVCAELGEQKLAKQHAERFLELSPQSVLSSEMLEIIGDSNPQ